MPKQNCWDFKQCGRQPGGTKVIELGVCPASVETKVNGVHARTRRKCLLVPQCFNGAE